MNRLLIGLAAALVVAGGGYFWWAHHGSSGSAMAFNMPGVTKDNPFGQSKDPNDPGEKMFRNGLYPEAIAYWTKEAEKGNPQAAHRLGVEYLDGKAGVVQHDYPKALKYHMQAALAGNALSMFDLGSMYEFGQGTEANMTEAAHWYGNSARYGLAQGQYNFATMLERGEGVPADQIEAYKFFILAARNGFVGIPYDDQHFKVDQNAPTPADLLRQHLTKAQLDEAMARANAFKPLTGPLQT